jgi:hypothetical protein
MMKRKVFVVAGLCLAVLATGYGKAEEAMPPATSGESSSPPSPPAIPAPAPEAASGAVDINMNDSLIEQIKQAWSIMPPPFRIVDSDEGDEPALLAIEFKHKPKWENLNASDIDRAPDGYGSALSFFADEAFRYYIAAYMTADILGKLQRANVVFALTHGLDDKSQYDLVNPLRFGQQRWIDVASAKFSMFDIRQVECIISYLQDRAKLADHEFDRPSIEQAIANYWEPRKNWLIDAKQGGKPVPHL